jgi:hypothetical protein
VSKETGQNLSPQARAKQAASDRLAKALRDNLHRRKAQARARKTGSKSLPLLVTDKEAQ